jgi:hypothetical protein
VSRDKMGGMVAKHPQLLGYSVDDNLRPTVQYLLDEVGVSSDKMGGMLASFPGLLSYSVDDNLRPTVQYFLDNVGIEKDQLRAKIETLPALLAYSLQKRIIPRHTFMVKHDMQLGTDIGGWLTRTDANFCESLGLSEEDYEKHCKDHLQQRKL